MPAEQPLGNQDDTRPTLTLNEVMRSHQRLWDEFIVNDFSTVKIENFKDFGIIKVDGPDNFLKIVDRNGNFLSLEISKKWQFLWKNLIAEVFPGQSYNKITKGKQQLESTDFDSARLSPSAKAIVDSITSSAIDIHSTTSLNAQREGEIKEASVFNIDNKYVAVVDLSSHFYVIYITQNEHGVSLPPEQWTRVQST